MTLSEDGRHVSLRFIGGKDPADGLPCSVEYAAWTNIVGEVLEVGVFEIGSTTHDELGMPVLVCNDMGYSRSLEVNLPEPFVGREWRDLAGYRHFLGSPDGLVEIDLPDGWLLIAERDVEESRTGRWERTYARTAGAPPHESLVVFQAFDGPANVSGGSEESATVDINGHPGRLYTWPPTREMVLVWILDGDGLALVAHEPTFTVESLIGLAESARLPA